ncbi:unnamed protein product, partial [Musa hybrid cultivar]
FDRRFGLVVSAGDALGSERKGEAWNNGSNGSLYSFAGCTRPWFVILKHTARVKMHLANGYPDVAKCK